MSILIVFTRDVTFLFGFCSQMYLLHLFCISFIRLSGGGFGGKFINIMMFLFVTAGYEKMPQPAAEGEGRVVYYNPPTAESYVSCM